MDRWEKNEIYNCLKDTYVSFRILFIKLKGMKIEQKWNKNCLK